MRAERGRASESALLAWGVPTMRPTSARFSARESVQFLLVTFSTHPTRRSA